MHHSRWTAGLLALVSAATCVQALGCWPFQPVEDGGGGAAGSGGAGGSEPPACSDDPVANPALVRDDCGTFVSPTAAPGGDGTKAKPFRSLGEAAQTGSRRIHVCAGDYNEPATVAFHGGVEIFAGFSACPADGAWTWDTAAKSTLTGSADAPALTLDGGDNHLENLNVTAPDAVASGASSIAVIVSGGTLNMKNGDLKAGAAMDGAPGASLPYDMALDGLPGEDGVAFCQGTNTNPGKPGPTKMCPDGSGSVAGKGGDGGPSDGTAPGGDGGDGTPEDSNQPTAGAGGAGEDLAACVDGTNGADGVQGQSGAGALGPGALSATGYAGVDGDAGMAGAPGQGGGGGGGAKGGTYECGGIPLAKAGASGGTGGTGGCGGSAGGGGQAGGSSIALVVVDAAVTLTDVNLSAGKAGNGGAGGDGQPPGGQGLAGQVGAGGQASTSCQGGNGGVGGAGGPGGGGQGGHSLAIALQGATAPVGGAFTVDAAGGTGGPGGANNTTMGAGQGANGTAADCWDFALDMACAQ